MKQIILLKQSINGCIKTPATENKYDKLKNSKSQRENLDYTENNIKIDETKEDKIREVDNNN